MGDQGLGGGVGDHDDRDDRAIHPGHSDSTFLDQIKEEQDKRDAVAPKVYIDRRQYRTPARIFLSLTSIASVLAIVVVVHSYIRLLRPPPLPYEYRLVDQAPDPPVLCPGQELTYTPVINITRAPLVINLYRTIYSRDLDQTYVFGGDPVVAIHDHVHAITRTYGLTVPNLPAGKYELFEAAQDYSTRATVFAVPFVVPGGCTPRPDLGLDLQRPSIRSKDQPPAP